jgi:glyoxylate/hydroxypyruvate reductase A
LALFIHLTDRDEAAWADALNAQLGGYPVYRRGDTFETADIAYALVWKPAPDTFDGLTNLKAVLSLGAGVDGLLRHPRLPRLPIVRFVDDELSQCMADYVVAHVAMHQRLHTRFVADQKARRWLQHYPAPATDLCVGVMGLGVIGMKAIEELKPLGYALRGWSRTARAVDGVETFTDLDAFLAGVDVLVCLLPLTPETEGILNYATFQKLRRGPLLGGPVVINAARGGHQREADLVRALTDGTLGAASLDVFEIEPLPKDSPLWSLENCYVTPHIAAISNERTGAKYFAKVIRDHEAGKPLPNLVDVARGY